MSDPRQDPLILAVTLHLPSPGASFERRAEWQRLMDTALDWLYGPTANVPAVAEIDEPDSGAYEPPWRAAPPDPEPSANARPVKPSTKAKNKAPQAPEWTLDEKNTLTAIIMRGGTVKEATAALPNRTSNAVNLRFYAEKKRLREAGIDPGPASASTPEPPPAPAPATITTGTTGPSPTPQPMPYSDKAVIKRLDGCANRDGWSDELDLELMQLLLGGTSAAEAATILEKEKAQVVSRFQTLCPDTGIDAQRQVLRLLKARAA